MHDKRKFVLKPWRTLATQVLTPQRGLYTLHREFHLILVQIRVGARDSEELEQTIVAEANEDSNPQIGEPATPVDESGVLGRGGEWNRLYGVHYNDKNRRFISCDTSIFVSRSATH